MTHGHEDHIGAIPYILKQINMPVYGTKLTIGLVESKLKEHDMLSKTNLIPISPGESIKLNKLIIEFIRVTHSIAESCALAIHTPIGIVLHTGDFKIDYTPIDGKVMDLNRIISNANGRVIVATFASNIHRMQQIADASMMYNRKIVFSGRSMENISNVAMDLGYLHIPEESIVGIEDLNR